MPAPEPRAAQPLGVSGTAAITPPLPSVVEAGDLLIMGIESGGATTGAEANTEPTAEGWTKYKSEKKGNTRLTVLYKIAVGGDATTTNDTGDHQIGRILGIKKNTFDAANPFNGTGGLGTQAPTKAVSIPGGETTVAECLILACASGNLPDAASTTEFGTATNASLTSITDRFDNTATAGDGGALFMVTGIKAAAGAYEATTTTAVTEAERVVMSFAIAPPAIPKSPPFAPRTARNTLLRR